jgi:hypothetical protein
MSFSANKSNWKPLSCHAVTVFAAQALHHDDSVILSECSSSGPGHVRVTVMVPLAGPGRTLVRVIAKPRRPAAARTRRGLGKHEQSAFNLKFFKETTASAAAAGDVPDVHAVELQVKHMIFQGLRRNGTLRVNRLHTIFRLSHSQRHRRIVTVRHVTVTNALASKT